MTIGTFAAGWYADNQDAALLRWWDGGQWTAHTQLRPVLVPDTPDAQAGGPVSGASAVGAAQPVSGRHERPSSKRDLHAEVDRLRQALDDMGVTEREQLTAEVHWLRDEVVRLRREHAGLSSAVVPLRAELAALNTQRAQMKPMQARGPAVAAPP